MGRVIAEGQVVFSDAPGTRWITAEPVNPTTMSYDDLGRVTATTFPDGTAATVTYAFATPPGASTPALRIRTKDAKKKLRDEYRDLADRVVAVTEHIEGRTPTTHYLYDALGQLVSIRDAKGNLTSMTYDLQGRRLTMDNPDAGLIEHAYDAAGNLIAKLTPNLRDQSRGLDCSSAARAPICHTYEYGRLVRIDYPASRDVEVEYGPPGAPENGAGRVVRIVDEAGEETRGYGRLGEVVRTT